MGNRCQPIFVLSPALVALLAAGDGTPPWDKSLLALSALTMASGALAGLQLMLKRQEWMLFAVTFPGFLLNSFLINLHFFVLGCAGTGLAFSYLYLQRFERLKTLWIHIGFSLAPLGMWLAIRTTPITPGILLMLFVFCWVTSSELLLLAKNPNTTTWAKIGLGMTVLILALFGFWIGLGISFLFLITVVAILFYWQQRFCKREELQKSILFWITNSLVGFFLLVWMVAEYHLPALSVHLR